VLHRFNANFEAKATWHVRAGIRLSLKLIRNPYAVFPENEDPSKVF
jgi:hypothetical protein